MKEASTYLASILLSIVSPMGEPHGTSRRLASAGVEVHRLDNYDTM